MNYNGAENTLQALRKCKEWVDDKGINKLEEDELKSTLCLFKEMAEFLRDYGINVDMD